MFVESGVMITAPADDILALQSLVTFCKKGLKDIHHGIRGHASCRLVALEGYVLNCLDVLCALSFDIPLDELSWEHRL